MENFEQSTSIAQGGENNREVDKKIETLKEDFLQFLLEKVDESKLNLGDVELFNELKALTKEYQDGQEAYRFDIFNFTSEELEPLWNKIDILAEKQSKELGQNASSKEKELLEGDKWQYSFDGRIIPKVKSPCVIGGLHGDETSLPNEMRELMEKYKDSIHLGDFAYLNPEVNEPALTAWVRAYPDSTSDINRGNISDPLIREIKEKVIGEILALKDPFILDLHNTFSLQEGVDGSRIDPFGFIIDRDSSEIENASLKISDDLLYKIKMAQELGLHHLIILPEVEETNGFLISEGRKIDKKIDGMSVEVDIRDKENMSSRLALHFLQMNGAINNGKPSSGLQMQHTLREQFLTRNLGMGIFKFGVHPKIYNLDFQEEEGTLCTVINGVPIRITKLALGEDNVSRIALNADDLAMLKKEDE